MVIHKESRAGAPPTQGRGARLGRTAAPSRRGCWPSPPTSYFPIRKGTSSNPDPAPAALAASWSAETSGHATIQGAIAPLHEHKNKY